MTPPNATGPELQARIRIIEIEERTKVDLATYEALRATIAMVAVVAALAICATTLAAHHQITCNAANLRTVPMPGDQVRVFCAPGGAMTGHPDRDVAERFRLRQVVLQADVRVTRTHLSLVNLLAEPLQLHDHAAVVVELVAGTTLWIGTTPGVAWRVLTAVVGVWRGTAVHVDRYEATLDTWAAAGVHWPPPTAAMACNAPPDPSPLTAVADLEAA